MNKLTSAEIISFFEQVRAPIESSSPTEAFQAVISVSPDLHRHLGKNAEMLMLLHGMDVSDRYLYSATSWVVCASHERSIPALSSERYHMINDKNITLEDAQSAESTRYFAWLEFQNAQLFYKKLGRHTDFAQRPHRKTWCD